mmetsp:Transcript_1162/g.3839  ORF Transcript_1162/g.3839 Transcript_1162/m.3839 type:complete len:277 (+) Transcript_1162:323-1153(+)
MASRVTSAQTVSPCLRCATCSRSPTTWSSSSLIQTPVCLRASFSLRCDSLSSSLARRQACATSPTSIAPLPNNVVRWGLSCRCYGNGSCVKPRYCCSLIRPRCSTFFRTLFQAKATRTCGLTARLPPRSVPVSSINSMPTRATSSSSCSLQRQAEWASTWSLQRWWSSSTLIGIPLMICRRRTVLTASASAMMSQFTGLYLLTRWKRTSISDRSTSARRSTLRSGKQTRCVSSMPFRAIQRRRVSSLVLKTCSDSTSEEIARSRVRFYSALQAKGL